MAREFFRRLFGGRGASGPSDKKHYEQAREAASSKHVDERRRLAGREDTEPEILYYLAEDPDENVRQAIAENKAAPRHADLLLARDGNPAVRSSLAEKIALLAPGLSADEQDKVRAMTYQVLEILAHDQMVRVREILSEILKDVADAPPALIRQLAWDAELAVSGPVLERSPVLSDDDLIEIVKSGPLSGALRAISRRQPVSTRVSDAIVGVDDEDAIAALLGNESAQIREETLDDLIDRAEGVSSWHAPLVKRPALSSAAAERLAEFVADSLLESLSRRNDLPASVITRVRREVHRRLKEGQSPDKVPDQAPAQRPPAPSRPASDMTGALEEAESLYKKGQLSIKAVTDAIARGDRIFIIAALSVRAGLDVAVIEKGINTESQKGLVAFTWKAGFPAKVATQLQRFFLKVRPNDVLDATPSGGFPLNEEEMTWQIEFFQDM